MASEAKGRGFESLQAQLMHIYAEKDGRPVYSFVYVDKVLDFLLSIGLKPMIQLSFLPEELAKDRKKLFGYLALNIALLNGCTDKLFITYCKGLSSAAVKTLIGV